MTYWKLGCRWYSKSPLFFDYLFANKIVISWTDLKYQINDIVLLTDGYKALGIARVLTTPTSVLKLSQFHADFEKLQIPSKEEHLLVFKAEIFRLSSSEQFTYKLQKGIRKIQQLETIAIVKKLVEKKSIQNRMQNYMDLLDYKKQIILQGPPGTGKTRLAREIALKVIGNTGENNLNELLTRGLSIPNASGTENYYLLEKVTANSVELSSEKATKKWSASFNKIKDKLFQLQKGDSAKDKGGDDPYVLAVAKYVLKKLEYSRLNLGDNEQFKLIQFHPSYTYEDFVRGMVSKPNPEGDGIVYEAENKTLAAFAEAALANYKNATQKSPISPVSDVFEAFIEYVKDEMALDVNHKYPITDAVYLFAADEARFKYKGDNWVAHQKGLNMKFSELKQIIEADIRERQEIKKMTALEELTRQHATYFLKVAERFYEFKANYKVADNKSESTQLKNYVLIIDEINRANLSSVLGELIYALEYRNEPVESMYEVDGSAQLVLPPNLYIIGTMNTADRSVGHIDYAIRRRFAFVDVLPEELVDNEEIYFNKDDFRLVANLFTDQNVSPEFEINAVQIGHSYFIVKKSEAQNEEERDKLFNFKMQYEVIPILEEYVRDGILLGKVGEQPILEYIRSLKKLV